MIEEIPGWQRFTLGGDKGYDRKELVQEMREHWVTPHFACKQTSIIDQRTMRHPGYALSQRKRKRVEEIFGWVKTVGGLRKTRHRGVARVDWMFSFDWRPTTWLECATWRLHQHESPRAQCPAVTATVGCRVIDGLGPTYSPPPTVETLNLQGESHHKSRFFRSLLRDLC